jgi:DNA-binding NarL/FixJ family response regulator
MTRLWLGDIVSSARPGVEVHECESVTELLERGGAACDVIIMDVADADAAATVAAIREQSSRVAVLVLASPEHADEAARCVAAGASAVLSNRPHEASLRATLALIWPPADSADSAPVAGRGGLCARELAILSAMADGLSNAEIGNRLFVSPDTVKTQAKRLFARLGVHDRAAAVAAGLRRHLIV